MSNLTNPAMRTDLQLMEGSFQENGSPSWTLFDPLRNRYFQIGWIEYLVLKKWNNNNPQQILESIQQDEGITVKASILEEMSGFLEANELLGNQDSQSASSLYQKFLHKKKQRFKALLMQYFFFRIPLIRPDRLLRATASLVAPLYGETTKWLLLFFFLSGLYLTVRNWSEFEATLSYHFSYESIYMYVLALIVAKVFHEFGHAYTARHYGCNVPQMGVAFMVLWPVLYTDTSSSWKLGSKKARLHIGAAGVLAELMLAVLATFAWSFFPEGILRTSTILLAAVTWISTLLINLNPFMRFDGYYLLSDLMGIANLQSRAFGLARWHLSELLFGFKDQPPEVLSGRLKNKLIIYAYITWVYRFLLYLGIALLVYHFLFKAAGIALMLLEVYMLIFRPIVREWIMWFKRRKTISLNAHTVTTLMVFIALLAYFVIPWKTHVSVPAVYTAVENIKIYVPVASQVKHIHVAIGQRVSKGDVLIELISPDLDFQVLAIEKKIAENQWRLDHSLVGDAETSVVLQDIKQSLLLQKNGLIQQQQKMTLTAPFNGVIDKAAKGLFAGRWLSEDEFLFEITDISRPVVTAYVDESYLHRVKKNQVAVFNPTDTAFNSLDLEFLDSELSATADLKDVMLSTSFNGLIQTAVDDEGKHVPRDALYRWQFGVLDKNDFASNEHKGFVKIKTDNHSLMSDIWNSVSAVLLRESGF